MSDESLSLIDFNDKEYDLIMDAYDRFIFNLMKAIDEKKMLSMNLDKVDKEN